MVLKNEPASMSKNEQMYMFCGLPTGVVIEPRLAAIVSMTTRRMMYPSSIFSLSIISSVKGTNISRATSLVKNMEETKTIATRRKESLLTLPLPLSSRSPT